MTSGEERPADEILVPDDARELEREVAAYHRELRQRRRRQRLDRLVGGARWRRAGLSAPLIAAVLVVVTGVAVLLVALHPSSQRSEAPATALATGVGRLGTVGGLVLDDTVTVDGVAKSAQALRPGVLALLPDPCATACAKTLDALAGHAGQYGLRVYLVAAAEGRPPTGALLGGISRGQVSAALDPGGVLAAAYEAHGLTAVLVRHDGVVVSVARDLTDVARLDGELGGLRPVS